MPRTWALYPALAATLFLGPIGCGPPRVGFDVQNDVLLPDVQLEDAGADTMDAALDARDASMDVRDAADAHGCDPVTCDQACTSAGLAGGVCRTAGCQCIGGPDGGEMDAARRDAGPDSTFDSGVRSCSPADAGADSGCSPSQFCNATACSGAVGFCALRPDPRSCDPDGVPSCGCDGVLYPSTCARLAAGVRLDPMSGCRGGADGGVDVRPGG